MSRQSSAMSTCVSGQILFFLSFSLFSSIHSSCQEVQPGDAALLRAVPIGLRRRGAESADTGELSATQRRAAG